MNNLGKLRFLLSGFVKRLSTRKLCPSCQSRRGVCVDRKWVYNLMECQRCGLLYRFPSDSQNELLDFYQEEYEERGLTTDVPQGEALQKRIETNFAGTFRDIAPTLELLEALEVKHGCRLLDFGASWGYQTFQFKQAGFDAEAYEVSRSRARAGKLLSLQVQTSLNDLTNDFDVVYSNHVLEHSGDPKTFITQKLSKLRSGGTLLCLTPNGSKGYRGKDWKAFHRSWGQVHPVLATDEFVRRNFGHLAGWVGNSSDIQGMKGWDRNTFCTGKTNDWELLIVLTKQ